MVKSRNKGRRLTDKASKFSFYADTTLKVILTTLVAFGVSNLMNIKADMAVIRLSYDHAMLGITENKKVNESQNTKLNKQEIRIVKIEQKKGD